VVLASGSPPLNPYTEEVSIRSEYAAGGDAFRKVIESIELREQRDPVEHAEAIAQLGDWYLVFDKFGSAGKSYLEAWQMLTESEYSNPTAAEYFGKPTPVKLKQQRLELPIDPQEANGSVFDISMDVTRSGKVKNVEILPLPGQTDNGQFRKAVRQIRKMRFRPRLNEGKPVKTDNFIWQYSAKASDDIL
jgi:hypothetical protein